MQKKVQHFCATCTGVQKSVQRFLRNMHGCACIVENIAQSRGANTLLSLATFLNLSYNIELCISHYIYVYRMWELCPITMIISAI